MPHDSIAISVVKIDSMAKLDQQITQPARKKGHVNISVTKYKVQNNRATPFQSYKVCERQNSSMTETCEINTK